MNNARRCGFCHQPVTMTLDTEESCEYHCATCDATETIWKGSGGSWWYAGWKRNDGAALRAPTSEEMHGGNYGWQPDQRDI